MNEPPSNEEPSFEMRVACLRARPRREQPYPDALADWKTFCDEFPELTEKHLFFVSLRPMASVMCTRRHLTRHAECECLPVAGIPT